MKIEFGFGRAGWNWRKHQIVLLPAIGIINYRLYYGYTRFSINITWLLWGAYVIFSDKRYAGTVYIRGETDEVE